VRALIRTITRKRKGGVAHRDQTFEGDELTIGRGTDQALLLPDIRVSLAHARIIALAGKRFRVESLVVAGIRVNDEREQNAVVKPGDNIEIAGTRIQVIKAPKGYDLALEITPAAPGGEATEDLVARSRMSLAEGGFGKRRASWALFLIVFVVVFMIPLAGVFIAPLGGLLRGTPLPGDGAWEAGELQAAHKFFGYRCETCHQRPFQRVRDAACTACHSTTPGHVDPVKLVATGLVVSSSFPELETTRCASCHADHNGSHPALRYDQALCADCHSDLTHNAVASELMDASDFLDDHPQFKVTLTRYGFDGDAVETRVGLDDPGLLETSSLEFPHDAHLDAEGLDTPSGHRVLNCGDCHQLDAAGGLMLPVNFETMCQDCHLLNFDPTAPDRQLPHGKPEQVLFLLEEFYAGRALRGEVQDPTAPEGVRTRRRPGQQPTRQEQQVAWGWAQQKARRVGKDLFEGRACGVCHEVTETAGDVDTRWQVQPARVTGNWFPGAFFRHNSHASMACGDCHDARSSSASTDVLMPGIDNCRDCHGNERSDNLLASACITCHRYHVPGNPAMAAQTRETAVLD